MQRIPWTEMTWREKPLDELSRSELLELCEVLHGMVWESASNFERLLATQFPKVTVAGHA